MLMTAGSLGMVSAPILFFHVLEGSRIVWALAVLRRCLRSWPACFFSYPSPVRYQSSPLRKLLSAWEGVSNDNTELDMCRTAWIFCCPVLRLSHSWQVTCQNKLEAWRVLRNSISWWWFTWLILVLADRPEGNAKISRPGLISYG
jgi:hypothetical protein